MKKTILITALSCFTGLAIAQSVPDANLVEITLSAPVVVGETDQARGTLVNMSPEAQRLGISSIRLSGAIKAEQQGSGESRLQINWSEVSIDNQAGESVSGTLDKPLESRFRTTAPAVRAGNQVRARGDMTSLNSALETLLTAKAANGGEGDKGRTGAKDKTEKTEDRTARAGRGAAGAGGNFSAEDPDSYNLGTNVSATQDVCAPAIDLKAGTVTPMTKRVVLDANGEPIAEGACAPSGTTAQIETDYQSCPIQIDNAKMTAFRSFRKYAVVDGKQMEVQGCKVDEAQELERVQDFASCGVIIPEMVAGGAVYPAYRWLAKDRKAGKDLIVSDCLRDLTNPYSLEAQTASCPDYVGTRQDGKIYPQEKLVYRDSNGVEQVAVSCRKVEGHPGFAVTETHEGCSGIQLENAAGKTLMRPATRHIYYDTDGVYREVRGCEPTAEITEIKHKVVGWKHGASSSELQTNLVYNFNGIDWYWKGSTPSVFAKVNHVQTTENCAGAFEDLDAHVTRQSTRSLIDVNGSAFDSVRSQLNIDKNGFVEAKACTDQVTSTIPHILTGWTDWRVTASRLVKEEVGRLELGDSCSVTWSNDTSHPFHLYYQEYNEFNDDPLDPNGGGWLFNNNPIAVKWTKTINISNRALKVSDLPSGIMVTGTVSPIKHDQYRFYSKVHQYNINNSARTEFTDSELTATCQTYKGSISKPTNAGFSLVNAPSCTGNDYMGCYRDLKFSGSLQPKISWERSTINVDTGTPFTWANPISPWKIDTGCVARTNPAPGDTSQICSGTSQTRERARVWKKPVINSSGTVTGWTEYEDLGTIDRQVSYLVN